MYLTQFLITSAETS